MDNLCPERGRANPSATKTLDSSTAGKLLLYCHRHPRMKPVTAIFHFYPLSGDSNTGELCPDLAVPHSNPLQSRADSSRPLGVQTVGRSIFGTESKDCFRPSQYPAKIKIYTRSMNVIRLRALVALSRLRRPRRRILNQSSYAPSQLSLNPGCPVFAVVCSTPGRKERGRSEILIDGTTD